MFLPTHTHTYHTHAESYLTEKGQSCVIGPATCQGKNFSEYENKIVPPSHRYGGRVSNDIDINSLLIFWSGKYAKNGSSCPSIRNDVMKWVDVSVFRPVDIFFWSTFSTNCSSLKLNMMITLVYIEIIVQFWRSVFYSPISRCSLELRLKRSKQSCAQEYISKIGR